MENNNLAPFFVRLLGLRDPHAEGHSNHVAVLSVALAQKIGLSAAQIKTLEFAAQIHDIGKIAINDFIVNKPGKYTEAEYGMIKQHSTIGASLVKTLPVDPIVYLTILHHHENFDGTGYPHKIKGEQIPLEARILRIADTYDALISNRVYHPARTHEEARRVIYQEEQKFDKDLLKVFFNLYHTQAPL